MLININRGDGKLQTNIFVAYSFASRAKKKKIHYSVSVSFQKREILIMLVRKMSNLQYLPQLLYWKHSHSGVNM